MPGFGWIIANDARGAPMAGVPARPRHRRLRRAFLILGLLLIGPGYLIFSGTIDTPIWSPVNEEGCRWHGLVPTGNLAPGETAWHAVPLPASHGGRSRIESVRVLGTAARADVSYAVVPYIRPGSSESFGTFKGVPGLWRPHMLPLTEGRLDPAPTSIVGDDPVRDATLKTTRSGVLLVVGFSATEPGLYEMDGFRMVFRQGWRKATCTRDWGAKFTVTASA